MGALGWKTGVNMTTQNLSYPLHQVSPTPYTLASVPVALAFKSLRHEHPKLFQKPCSAPLQILPSLSIPGP